MSLLKLTNDTITRMTRPSQYKSAGKKACRAVGKAGAFACECLFWVCCSPCILGAICLFKPRRAGCVIQPYEAPKPAKPEPRLRRLTLPLAEEQDEQKTCDQSQSSFIYKLPLEIRRMIYIEVLGNTTISLRTWNGKPYTQRYHCHSCVCKCSRLSTVQKPLGFGLALLETCRQMYARSTC